MPLRRHNGTGPAPDSPSLDRVIPELGYVPGNVIVISWRANNLKRDATIEELEAVIAYMRAPASDGRQLLSDMHSGPRRAGCHGPAQTEPI